MPSSEIGSYVKFTKVGSEESIKIDQKYLTLRESSNKIMAFSLKAPIYETIEFERFFDKMPSSQKIKVNIGETGGFGANFRGLILGKENNYSKDIAHFIVYLEEYKCPKKEEIKNIGKSSHRFNPKVKKKADR